MKLMANKDATIRVHAAKALGKLKINAAIETLMAQLKKDPSPEVRMELVKALAKLQGSPMDEAIKIALADKEKKVRVVGLDLLNGLKVSTDLKVSLLGDVIKSRTTEEKQAAITTLGSLPLASTEKLLTQLLDQMESGKLPKEVQLEFSDAIDSSKSQTLIGRYKKLSASSSADSLKAVYTGALLGGDPSRGGNVIWSNSSAQCLRCHAYDDYGGNIGPRFNGIANRITREQMLEALIEPSARIAPGFGMVTLELKNNQKVNGILQSEKPDGYVMKVADKPDTLIKKSDVVNRINAPSSMPPMHFLLTKREIRDVVSFLATLKGVQ
jgi:putative heme-binding domain-containing protein